MVLPTPGVLPTGHVFAQPTALLLAAPEAMGGVGWGGEGAADNMITQTHVVPASV